jgi:hypothetical protein
MGRGYIRQGARTLKAFQPLAARGKHLCTRVSGDRGEHRRREAKDSVEVKTLTFVLQPDFYNLSFDCSLYFYFMSSIWSAAVSFPVE